MKLTNEQIYNYTMLLNENFQDSTQRLPIKLNFYIQKNKAILLELAREIEKAKLEIINSYGEVNSETGQYIVPEENIKDANNELNDLFNLEQEVTLYKIDQESFINDDIMLTTGQMESIIFMIE